MDLLKRGPASSSASAGGPGGAVAGPSPAAAAAAPAQAVAHGAVALYYLAGAPVLVIGSATRAAYRFSRAAPLQKVARADVEALLASGYFRREP